MKEEHFPVVCVIPSLNPDAKLVQTAEGILRAGISDLLIVDDGSRPECQTFFSQAEALPGCIVLHHEQNRGKGRALKTAFAYYLEHYDTNYFQGVVTADADGQHLPEDIAKTARAICPFEGLSADADSRHENILAQGARDFDAEDVPPKSRFGNKLTMIIFYALYQKKLHDIMTGLRGIPNDFLKTCLETKGERFEYEVRFLIAAAQENRTIIEVPIQTVYFDGNRETHFDPIRDSIRVYKILLDGFFKFAAASLLCVIVDQGLFALLTKLVLRSLSGAVSIPLATAAARMVSSFLNYTVNRSVVFEAGKTSRRTLIRYYILCVLQMAMSAACVTVFHLITHVDPSILKILTDTLLFLVSYQIQRRWVFKKES